MFTPELVTGTLVNYYATCVREAWLYGHHIHADQEDENVLMGKTLAELKEARLQEFPFAHLHFDKLSKERGHYCITEYKKTLKNPAAAKAQLLFYMYVLKTGLKLKKVQGKVVCKKQTLLVEDTPETMAHMARTLEAIAALINTPMPPPPVRQNVCTKCAYRTYCW